MRQIFQNHDVAIPEKVSIFTDARIVKVTGPRGTVEKSFKHANVQIMRIGKVIRVQIWSANKKQCALVRTIASHIQNMIKGVTEGILYKMRAVHAHFPINCNIIEDNTVIELRNFLGQKVVRRIKMLDGVQVVASKAPKDEYVLSGIDIQKVSQSAASIHQALKVKGKDTRKFLDGIYVSHKTTMAAEE